MFETTLLEGQCHLSKQPILSKRFSGGFGELVQNRGLQYEVLRQLLLRPDSVQAQDVRSVWERGQAPHGRHVHLQSVSLSPLSH